MLVHILFFVNGIQDMGLIRIVPVVTNVVEDVVALEVVALGIFDLVQVVLAHSVDLIRVDQSPLIGC